MECPYLCKIRRDLLDFDFEKVCSVSLSPKNVHACLSCGLYFQGRGRHTHAYTHSLEADHHLFISFQDKSVYCLPDSYEVIDPSLYDIKYNMDPVFTEDQIKQLNEEVLHSKTLEGEDFMPGLVGMNNLKQTDYVNVVLQLICAVKPLRDYFLVYKDDSELRFDLNGIMTQHLSELVRKVWNPRNFKGHVNPHEVMQAITGASHKMFKIGFQKDPTILISWLLNSLNSYISTKKKSSIITDLFRGYIEVSAEALVASEANMIKPSKTKKPFW